MKIAFSKIVVVGPRWGLIQTGGQPLRISRKVDAASPTAVLQGASGLVLCPLAGHAEFSVPFL